MRFHLLLLTTLSLATLACASDEASDPPAKDNESTADQDNANAGEPEAMQSESSPEPARPDSKATAQPKEPAMPFGPGADFMPFTTDKVALKAGEETYQCFAKTLESDLVVNGFSSTRQTFVHHLLVARVRAPEPDGFQDCGVSFRATWEPMYISGVGENKLEYPEDAGTLLKAGGQLLVQLHLLNASDKPVEGAVTVNLRLSKAANPRPISGAVFGTGQLTLPPQQASTVTGTCAVRQPLHLVAGFGHMHTLGTSITFEVGQSASTMKQLFNLDPFNFDDQKIEKFDVTLNPGDMTRTTCTYNNTTDKTITYGESTLNEMCYFVSFAVDLPAQGGCLEKYPSVSLNL